MDGECEYAQGVYGAVDGIGAGFVCWYRRGDQEDEDNPDDDDDDEGDEERRR